MGVYTYMDTYTFRRIALQLTCAKDCVRFGTLSKSTWDATRDIPIRMVLTRRVLQKGGRGFCASHHHRIPALTLTRLETLPIALLLSLTSLVHFSALYCRVPWPLLQEMQCFTSLTSLTIHHLEPGDDPGLVMPPCPCLKTVALTFSKTWGLVVLSGLSRCPMLEAVTLRGAATLRVLEWPAASLKYLACHASHRLMIDAVPTTLERLDVAVPNDRLPWRLLFPDGCLYPHLRHLTIDTMGLLWPEFIEAMPNLHILAVHCDSFGMLGSLCRHESLRYLTVDARHSYVIPQTPEEDVETFKNRVTLHLTVWNGRPYTFHS